MIRPLTSFRFIAAFLVFLHHIGFDYGFGEGGVTFFFILSGFILAIRYYDVFSHGVNRYRLVEFYISKISRIYPVHISMFLFSLSRNDCGDLEIAQKGFGTTPLK